MSCKYLMIVFNRSLTIEPPPKEEEEEDEEEEEEAIA